MNQADFEHELEAQGYRELVDRRMEAGAINPEHAHEFDARLLVLEGEMTIVCDGEERTYRAILAQDKLSVPDLEKCEKNEKK